MSKSRAEHSRENAEIHRGHTNCKSKIHDLLHQFHLPLDLLPLENLKEFGFVRLSGFMWVTQTKSTNHNFKRIKQQVSFETEMTGFVEERRMWKVVGVKTKVLFIWFGITKIFVDDSGEKITFITDSGLSETFPVNAFDLHNHDSNRK